MRPLVRVTQLEKFRRYMSGNYPYETEEGLVANITQEFTGNEYTRVGTAFHSIVETGRTGEATPDGHAIDVDGFKVLMDDAQCETALAYKAEFPQAFHEVRLYHDLGGITVTGQADLVNGQEIRDIKTKYSPVSDGDYTDSCQWRLYLQLFQMDVFHFDIFVFEGYDKGRNGYDVRGLKLTRHTPPITCYRYHGMEADNERLAREFMEWARKRELTKYLTKDGQID